MLLLVVIACDSAAALTNLNITNITKITGQSHDRDILAFLDSPSRPTSLRRKKYKPFLSIDTSSVSHTHSVYHIKLHFRNLRVQHKPNSSTKQDSQTWSDHLSYRAEVQRVSPRCCGTKYSAFPLSRSLFHSFSTVKVTSRCISRVRGIGRLGTSSSIPLICSWLWLNKWCGSPPILANRVNDCMLKLFEFTRFRLCRRLFPADEGNVFPCTEDFLLSNPQLLRCGNVSRRSDQRAGRFVTYTETDASRKYQFK